MKIRKEVRDEKIEVPMTPMIDIVFQLLVFFIMTFKIVLPEGDFNIRMPPPASQTSQTPEDIPALPLVMTSNDQGQLTSLRLGERDFKSDGNVSAFEKLRIHVAGLAEDDAGPDTAVDQEIELVCDYELNYKYVIEAITAVSGYIKDGQRYKLIEKIRFAPSKE